MFYIQNYSKVISWLSPVSSYRLIE